MTDWESEDDDASADAEHADSSALDYEESLDRDADEWHWYRPDDRYDEMAEAVAYDRFARIDDRPAWEQALTAAACRICQGELELDALGTCPSCRRADGRCAWCGLDPVVYTSTESCRTCYRHLDRVGATKRPWDDPRLRVTLLVAGFRRSDLRQRRSQRPSAP